jgi:hypothetical protein
MNGDYTVPTSWMVISPTWRENSHVVSVSLLRAFIPFQLAVSGSSVNGDLRESTCKSHAFSKSNRTTSEWPMWDAKCMRNIPSTPLFLTYVCRVYLLYRNRSRIKSTFPISAKEWRGLWPVRLFLMFTSAPYSAAIQWRLSFRAGLLKTTSCVRQCRECWHKFQGLVRLHSVVDYRLSLLDERREWGLRQACSFGENLYPTDVICTITCLLK